MFLFVNRYSRVIYKERAFWLKDKYEIATCELIYRLVNYANFYLYKKGLADYSNSTLNGLVLSL